MEITETNENRVDASKGPIRDFSGRGSNLYKFHFNVYNSPRKGHGLIER